MYAIFINIATTRIEQSSKLFPTRRPEIAMLTWRPDRYGFLTFHFNVIIECSIFVLVFLIISPLLWAVVSALVAFLTLGAHVFIVHMLCFLCSLVVMCS